MNPNRWFQNLVIAANAQQFGERDGMLGVARVAGGKQKITV